jgi:uncharacterized membrane protein YdfJ with MMPL/SSD domain
MLAFPILFVLSLLIFRGLIAALLPLAVGGTSILITFLVMRAVNEGVGLSIFAINLVTGLGLGLAIDYSLFMVSRFREEMASGADTRQAILRTINTAGRTVLFSALTVAAALAALLVFPQKFLYSMGIGGLVVSLSAAFVSLTFLPAMLAALGPRVDALSLRRRRPAGQGGWYRLARGVMRRPGRVAAVTALLMIALGLPFTGIKFTGADASVLPEQHSARVVDDPLRVRRQRDEPGVRGGADVRPGRGPRVRAAARSPAGRAGGARARPRRRYVADRRDSTGRVAG